MMHKVVWPARGHYILAVSGGADSMVLLDLLASVAQPRGYQLTVAHFDHGMRPRSGNDRRFVEAAARHYGLPFEAQQAELGQASEAAARTARHSWLEQVRQTHEAMAVVTAHHADDLIETSLLNLARGSGRRGLAPMQDGRIIRPLIDLTRAELRRYAADHGLDWREDPTNSDSANPRNFLRHNLLPRADAAWRRHYLNLIHELGELNNQIDRDLEQKLVAEPGQPASYFLKRETVRDLSLPELEELLLFASRRLQPEIEPGSRTLREMAVFSKTAHPHRHRPLRQGLNITIEADGIHVKSSI